MTDTKKWSLLAGLLVVGMLVTSWFLLISPKRSEASELRDQKVTQEQANQELQQKIVMLKALEKDLPKQQARMAEIALNMPNNPQLPRLIRELTASAAKSGVDLVSLAPSQPVALTAAGVAAPQASGAAAPAGGVMQIPIVLTTTGDYFESVQFVNKLESLKRSFLVTGITVSSANGGAAGNTASAAPAAAGASAQPGDVQLSITGRVFMAAPASATTPAAPAPASPAPVTNQPAPAAAN